MDMHQCVDDLVESRICPILGDEYNVYHEDISDEIHLDALCWAPTADRGLWTLVTSGMHVHKMTAPEEMEEYSRAEFVMTLPPYWPVVELNDLSEEEAGAAFWPVELLRRTARYAKTYDTWVSYGHTIQAGSDLSETYPSTDFCGLVLGSPGTIDTDEDLLETPYDDGVVKFLGLYPIYRREMEFGMHGNSLKLLDKLYNANIYEGLIPDRYAVM